MRYVDAGYVICLTVLFLYAVGLVLRHRRLARAAALAERPGVDGAAADHAVPDRAPANLAAADRVPPDRAPDDRAAADRPGSGRIVAGGNGNGTGNGTAWSESGR